jgi:hypothetical protein
VVLVAHPVAVVVVAIQLQLHQQQLLPVLVPLQVIQERLLLTVLVAQVEQHADQHQAQILLVQLDRQTQVMVVAVHLPRVQAVTLTVALVVQVY